MKKINLKLKKQTIKQTKNTTAGNAEEVKEKKKEVENCTKDEICS